MKSSIDKAQEWYENHKDHVNSLIISHTGVMYEPSSEDRDHPELWKPAHWKWFFFITESKLAKKCWKVLHSSLFHDMVI